jgi:acyl-CoA synthetase (AMP-forming)/AMP-acid ligase II
MADRSALVLRATTRLARVLSEALSTVWGAGGPDQPAVVVPEDGASLTFAELASRVEDLGGRLRGLGVETGDRVAIALPNGPEIVQLVLAAAAVGAAAAPLNPAYTTDEFAFYLDDLAPRVLLLPEGELAAARAAAGDTETVEVSTDATARVRLRSGRGEPAPAAFPSGGPEDVAILLHTSGTTSRPKQVPLLQRNLVASARSIAAHYRLGPSDVSYVAMPLFHIHGLVASTFATLLAGGTVVCPRRLAPRRFRAHLAEHRVTWFSAGPTIHQMLLERAEPTETQLRFIRSCSSALSPELMRRCEEAYGVPMLEAYGMTEASHEMAANPLPPGERRPGTVGVPTGARVRIVDGAWRDLPEGEPGEVIVTGPGLTPGYLGNPEANAASFQDRWFRTGDQGVLEDGYLRLVGRIKELIIRGGENISPLEVEEVLLAHRAVAEAVCFGIPDEKYGEVVAVAVALSEPAEEPELIRHCRERLTAVKVPAVVHVLAAIPRTPTGKVQRRRVAAAIYGE